MTKRWNSASPLSFRPNLRSHEPDENGSEQFECLCRYMECQFAVRDSILGMTVPSIASAVSWLSLSGTD